LGKEKKVPVIAQGIRLRGLPADWEKLKSKKTTHVNSIPTTLFRVCLEKKAMTNKRPHAGPGNKRSDLMLNVKEEVTSST